MRAGYPGTIPAWVEVVFSDRRSVIQPVDEFKCLDAARHIASAECPPQHWRYRVDSIEICAGGEVWRWHRRE